jgi:hypothetical protein
MNRVPSTGSLKGEAERQPEAHSSASSSSWLACWPQWRTQRGLLTIAMCLLLVCAAFMGVFGYGFGLGQLTDRCRPARLASVVFCPAMLVRTLCQARPGLELPICWLQCTSSPLLNPLFLATQA